MVVKEDTQKLTLWHDCLGHPGSIMMQRIIENSHRNTLKVRRSFKLVKFHVRLVL